MRLLEQWGLLKLQTPYETFYDLEATDEDGQAVDFQAYRNKVVLVTNVAPVGNDATTDTHYRVRAHCRLSRPDLRHLVNRFASLPGQPFCVLILPCEQFGRPGRRLSRSAFLRRTSSDHSLATLQAQTSGGGAGQQQRQQAAAASQSQSAPRQPLTPRHLVQHAAEAGLPPVVRILATSDVNGPNSHPMWTWLKVASGDTSDTGDNFGKFLVSRDGRDCGRFCAPLRPAFLEPAIVRLLHELTDGEAPGRQLSPTPRSSRDEARGEKARAGAAAQGSIAEVWQEPVSPKASGL